MSTFTADFVTKSEINVTKDEQDGVSGYTFRFNGRRGFLDDETADALARFILFDGGKAASKPEPEGEPSP